MCSGVIVIKSFKILNSPSYYQNNLQGEIFLTHRCIGVEEPISYISSISYMPMCLKNILYHQNV
jgi:hypothetical protein